MIEEFKVLKIYSKYLSKQQYKTFKGQILSGDTNGFRKGLFHVIKNKKGISNERIHNRKADKITN